MAAGVLVNEEAQRIVFTLRADFIGIRNDLPVRILCDIELEPVDDVPVFFSVADGRGGAVVFAVAVLVVFAVDDDQFDGVFLPAGDDGVPGLQAGDLLRGVPVLQRKGQGKVPFGIVDGSSTPAQNSPLARS